jgi:hypothetical protein
MPLNMPVLKETEREIHAFRTNALAIDSFAAQATVAASTVSSTVLARKLLPIAAKIGVVAVYFTAITALDGSASFNIVVGEGSESGTSSSATGTYTLTGTPTTTDTNTYVINGITTTNAQTTGNTLAVQATSDAAAITAATATNHVTAVAVGAVITLTANTAGPAGNGITTTGSSNGGDTVTANQAALSGGASGVGPVGPADQTDVSGTPYAIGASVASGYAAAGNQVFSVDQALTVGAGVGAPLYQPALAVVTTATGGVLRFVPTVPDTIYPAGTVLTLRAATSSTTSITNFVVSYEYVSLIPVKTQPSNNQYFRAGYDL